MATTNINPVQNALIDTGEAFSCVITAVGATEITMVVSEGVTPSTIWTLTGGFQAGYSGTVSSNAGVHTFTDVVRTAGWWDSPMIFTITETIGGVPTEQAWTYYIKSMATYPPGAKPYNERFASNVSVTEGGVFRQDNVNQFDFDDATFNITGDGAGKATIVGVALGGDLDTVLTSAPIDNDVTVDSGDPVILRDGGVSFTPLEIDSTNTSLSSPAIRINRSALYPGLKVESANYDAQYNSDGIRFGASGTVGRIYRIEPSTSSSTGDGASIYVFGGYHSGSGTGGNVNIEGGASGTGSSGIVNVGILSSQTSTINVGGSGTTLRITDSGGSTGLDNQVLTSNGAGDATWEGVAGAQSLDEVITNSPIDNQVYVPIGQGVEFLNQDAADPPLTAVQNYDSATVPALLARSANSSTPCIIAEEISGGLGVDIDPTSISFKPETSPSVPTFRYIRGENVTRAISADDVVVKGGANLGTGAGGDLLLAGGSGVSGVGGDVSIYPGDSSTTSGAILIGTVTTPSAITIKDSAGATGTAGQPFVANGVGDSTWSSDITVNTVTATDAGETTEYAEYGIAPYASRTTQFTIGGTPQTTTTIDVSLLGMASNADAVTGGKVYVLGGNALTGNADGGPLYLAPGTGFGSGVDGDLFVGGFAEGSSRTNEIRVVQGFSVAETSDHPATPTTGRGQFWVRSSDSKPIFTDDGGTDFDLTEGTGGGGGTAPRLRGVAVLSTDVGADTTISIGTNATGSLLAYTDGADFRDNLETYINGQLQRSGSTSGDNYDVYAAGTAGNGDFACEYALESGTVIQQFDGGGTNTLVFHITSRIYGGTTQDEWFGPPASGDFFAGTWNQSRGTGATPTAYVYDGFPHIPVAGTVKRCEVWVRKGTDTSSMEIGLFEVAVTDGSTTATPTLLNSSTVPTTGTAGPIYDASFALNDAVSQGNMLALYFREKQVATQSDMWFKATITMEV